MLYLGIDLHSKQLTVSLRNEAGDVVVRRQVSTRPAKVEEFLKQVHELEDGRYVALLEVCGFHDWLVERLRADERCQEVVLIQPEQTSRKKTDARDTNRLGELLWVNRQRLLAGAKVQGLRRVYIPTDEERQDRQLTSQRQRLTGTAADADDQSTAAHSAAEQLRVGATGSGRRRASRL